MRLRSKTRKKAEADGLTMEIMDELRERDLFSEEDLVISTEEIPEKEAKIRVLAKRTRDNIEFLNSCVTPNQGEKITIKTTTIEKGNYISRVEYSIIERDSKTEYVSISYLVDFFMKKVREDFSILKMSMDSKLLANEFLKGLGVEYDEIVESYLRKCFGSSNSFDSLSLFLGYSLLTPNKVSRVEETKSYDEYRRKIMNVYTMSFRDVDTVIIGAGVSIAKHLDQRWNIKPCYE